MIALDGIRMGYSFVTLDPTPNSPLGQMAEQVTARYDDVEVARHSPSKRTSLRTNSKMSMQA